MPKNPSMEQRIEWHLAHVQNCACRGIPPKLLEEIRKRQITVPSNPEHGVKAEGLDFKLLDAEDPRVKYGFVKVLLEVAAQSPELLYPEYHRWHRLLHGDNEVLRWTAIDIMGKLAAVDRYNLLDAELPDLIGMLHQGHLVTTAHIVKTLESIAHHRPHLRPLVLGELIHVADDQFDNPECREIAIGKVSETLVQFVEHLSHTPEVFAFVQRACSSSRAATAKKGNRLRNVLAQAM